MLLLWQINVSQSQDILLFPESSIKLLSDMPVDVCMRQATQLTIGLTDNDTSKATQLRTYGMQLMNQGQHEYAKEILEKVVEVSNKAYGKNDIRYINALIDLARVYILLIRYAEAAGMFEEALTTLEKTQGKASRAYLATLNESIVVHSRIKDYIKARKLCQESVDIIKEQGKEQTIFYAISINNLGACKKNLGYLDEAIQDYTEALELTKGNPRYAISIAANLAETYALTGKLVKAKELMNQYHPIANQLISTNDISHARVWLQYGIAYTTMKDFEQAEKSFKKALVTNSLTYDAIESIPEQADDLMFKNDYMATCGQAANIMFTIIMYKSMYEETQSLEALRDGYKVVKAIYKYGEKLMSSYISEENKLILFRLGAMVIFDLSTYYAYELYQNTGEQQYLDEAFLYAERSKSTLLINTLRSKNSQEYVNLPQELLEQEKDYRRKVKELEKKQIEARTADAKQEIQRSINELKIEIETFKTQLRKDYPAYYQHHYNVNLIDRKAIQDYLTEDQVLIEYSLNMDLAYAFVVSKNDVDIVKLNIDPNEYRIQTNNLRKGLSDYSYISNFPEKADSIYTNAAQYFYTAFVEPALVKVKNSSAKQLIIVPDQNLGHLPFEVFLTEKPQKAQNYGSYPYLLNEYSISYSYSATLLLLNAKAKQKRIIPKRGVLAFAAEYKNSASGTALTNRRGADIAVIRKTLQPLPGAKQEVDMMRQYLYGEFYDGYAANEAKFKEHASDYGIIHLAMHGVLDDDHPILSSLIFSEDSTTQEDNFLRAYEIAQLNLNADLVVLSACETGYGKFRQGEGIMSLAHSFTYAGASSVLMSLWQVNDYATGQIMKNFYTQISEGLTKNEALRQAKLQFLKEAKNGTASHPAFWAAFLQMGDTDPLELVCKAGMTSSEKNWLITGLAALFAILSILGIRFFRAKKNETA